MTIGFRRAIVSYRWVLIEARLLHRSQLPALLRMRDYSPSWQMYGAGTVAGHESLYTENNLRLLVTLMFAGHIENCYFDQ